MKDILDFTGKIILGNCLDIMMRLNDKVFDVSFTSPPYNRKRNDTYELYNDVCEDYLSMLNTVTAQLLRLTKGNVIINVQSNMYNKADVARWQGIFADKIKGVVVWTKKNPVPSWNYKPDRKVYSVSNAIEYFIVFGDDNQDFDANSKILNYINTAVNDEHFEGHGAVMKRDVASFFIRNFSKEGDLVFDPFMGMGTTAVVCEETKRRWCGCEIVPEYRERSLARIEAERQNVGLEFDFTGGK